MSFLNTAISKRGRVIQVPDRTGLTGYLGRSFFLFSAGVWSREGACVVVDTIRESAVESEIEEEKGDV